jgi:hypothetical protein
MPRERSSGEKRQFGHITNAGNGCLRWLSVEAAWQLLRSKSAETAALRAWSLQIAPRRGQRIALVALAHRLAGVLYAMWRDDVANDAPRIRAPAMAIALRAAYRRPAEREQQAEPHLEDRSDSRKRCHGAPQPHGGRDAGRRCTAGV